MTRLVLDKNPEQTTFSNLGDVTKTVNQSRLCSIIHSNPFLKTIFLKQFISINNIPTIYLDFDLLYSGYFTTFPKHVTIIPVGKNLLNENLQSIILKLSREKSLLIIDSLNSFFNHLEERKDVGRLVNSYIMLLVCAAKMSKSSILLTCLAKQKNENELVLSPSGRKIIETKDMTKIFLERQNSKILLNVMANNNPKKNPCIISIESELI